jgi:5-methyltetrahydropteroyltriglutamate--homocysteine methyltransferase
MRLKYRGKISKAEFDRVADAAVLEALRAQESAGVDYVTDGEQRRDNFYSFVAEKIDGVRLMTLGEMLDVVEDKAGFELILQTLDVPAFQIRTPTCAGILRRREPLALDEYKFLRDHTNRRIKTTLPGPYLLTRAMWVKEVTSAVYRSKEDLGEDVVRILRDELIALRDAGCDFVQFDEPVLTELVFSKGRTRTFMCAALAATQDPTEELEFASSLLNRVIEGVGGIKIGLHICRGNWSRNEQILLSGSYYPLVPYLKRIRVKQFVFEFSTPRAGELAAISDAIDDKELGLGVVNPRTSIVETPEEIAQRVKDALRFVSADRLFLNPDCGFGTFAERPVSNQEIAKQKLLAICRAATMP